MSRRWIIGALVAAWLLSGCSNKCKQDTDCTLPQVCINSSCINPYFPDGMPEDLEGELEEPPDGWPDTDTILPDGQDGQPEEDGDGTGPCSSIQTPPHQTSASSVDSGADEHPEVVTLADGSFYVLRRSITPADDNPYKYSLIKIAKNAGSLTAPIDILGAPLLPGYHQLLAIGNDMGVLFKAPPEMGEDRIVYIHVTLGSVPPADYWPISVTDPGSSEPFGADNGRNLFVVYRQASPAGMGGTIESCFVEYNGETATAGLRLGGDESMDLGQPVVSSGGTSYLLAYFYHGDPDLTELDKLVLREVSSDGSPIETEGEQVPLKNGDNKVVGRPAIAWAGDRWAVFWEEAPETGATDASLHLTTKVPGSPAMDMDITPQWGDSLSPLTRNQPGELDMIWNGATLGLVIKHDAATAKKIYWGE